MRAERASFRRAYLERAVLRGGDFSQAVFKEARVERCDIRDAKFERSDWSSAQGMPEGKARAWRGAVCPSGEKAVESCDGQYK